MKYLFLIAILFTPSFAFASDSAFLDDVVNTITGFPDFVEKAFAYFIEWFVYIKFHFYVQTVQFSYGVAKNLADNLGLFDMINAALSNLTNENRAILEAYGFREGFTIIINSLMTRFVLNFMGA